MLRAFSNLRARVHPIKAAEKGVAAAAEATAKQWHALQHLSHKLHSLEASRDQAAAADPDKAGPSNAADPSTGAAYAALSCQLIPSITGLTWKCSSLHVRSDISLTFLSL